MHTNVYPVELDKIIPSLTNPRKYFSEAKLKELAASIKQHGVIQDVTIRDHPKVNGKYELVFGERRYRASKLAGLATIPAKIRQLNDDEVQELQFVENLEREDVHPMDEAVTFKAMMNSKTRPWSVDDIAGKINRPVSYIVQRLQLTKLIEPLRKEFWDGEFLIGHAQLFSRLTPADQNECIKKAKRGGQWGTVKDTHDYIERNITKQLSSAPFSIHDILEVKCGAGACINCIKRSGSSELLFPDIKAEDRCHDKVCFQEKTQAWLIREVKKVLDDHPEIILADQGSTGPKTDPQITRLASQYKAHIYKYSTGEFVTSAVPGYSSFRALWVNGHRAGSYDIVYRKTAVKTAAAAKVANGKPLTKRDINLQIGAIKEHQAKAEQIDAEKIWQAVSEKISTPYFSRTAYSATILLPDEAKAVALALFNCIPGDEYTKAAASVLQLANFQSKDITVAKQIGTVTEKQIFHLLRLFMLANLKIGSSHLASPGPFLLMPVLKIYARKEIEAIELLQQDEAAARFKRATKQIEKLEEQKKMIGSLKENVAT